ncbi:MAG: MBL fold metallo-hydrolase [Clostridia bacterium]|nr:MBL fold metallo-hydrolase [Clostridia bacterium]
MSFEMRETVIQQTDIGPIVAGDILCLPVMIVNVCLIGNKDEWVLVDTGVGNSEGKILQAAEKSFGENSPPKAIVLTHGHFDHIGAVTGLMKRWNIPVYAHESELPYLTGKADYPPPDPSVGGGLMAAISPVYPNQGINLGDQVIALPRDGNIPFMPGWQWIHTPGHTAGHISLFRERDRVLIAGDAFTTVKQESAMAVLTKKQEVHGPPAYFTTDWKAAWDSVKQLEALNPQVVISSHGLPLSGEKLTNELKELARNFDKLAIPDQGKYVQ